MPDDPDFSLMAFMADMAAHDSNPPVAPDCPDIDPDDTESDPD